MTDPKPVQTAAPLLPYLGDASPERRDELREGFYAWLRDPAHQEQQITQSLFRYDDQGPCCCAFGALLLHLEAHGYARLTREDPECSAQIMLSGMDPDSDLALHDGVATLRSLDVSGQVNGPWEPASRYPDELAILLDLGESITMLTLLNDHDHSEHQGPLSFVQIADYMRPGVAKPA